MFFILSKKIKTSKPTIKITIGNRRTLSDIASKLKISQRTLRRKFDIIGLQQKQTSDHNHNNQSTNLLPINLGCGQELKELAGHLSTIDPRDFLDRFFASINYHLEYLFTYKEHPNLKIPNTTNDLEEKFAHLKERIKIHRGMTKNRKKKQQNSC